MELKAFVGHSFTDEDATVVRVFLDYFDQLQRMSFGFSWEHAKVAEPKILAEKVLSQVSGKNLFIGICTKKELVINQHKLHKTWTGKSYKADTNDFYWKTSDWVIQEIGLAVGKGMHLVLLVEDGLRPPGGLQGSLEYIPFDRNAPERSFGKILEMIRSLLPTSGILRVEEQRIESASTEPSKSTEAVDNYDFLSPKPEWNFFDYCFAFMRAITLENVEAESLLDDAYLKTEDGKIASNRVRWEAARTYYKASFGKASGSITALEKLAEANPTNEHCFFYLAQAYRDFEEYNKAAESYFRSGELSNETKFALSRFKDAASAWIKSGNTESAELCLINILESNANERDLTDILIETRLLFADNEGNNTQSYALLEYWLDLHPDDNDKRFKIAYKYSLNDYNALALLHYLNIPYLARSGITWNNIGVAYNQFSLYSKSINSYRKSADEYNETLAMSNIANKFIDIGCIKEANDYCNKALEIKDYSKNILYSITRYKELPELEDSKEKEILDKAKKVRDFHVAFGKAILHKETITLNGTWDSPQCKLKVTLKNREFTAEGSYKVKGLGLAAIYSQQDTQFTSFSVKYSGQLTGMGIQGTVVIDRNSASQGTWSLLSENENKHELVMILNDTMDIIDVYDKDASEGSRFSQLIKL